MARMEGFTLIEVLVAMVILAIGLLGLEALGVSVARQNAQADRRSGYVALATDSLESALARLRAGESPGGFCSTLATGEKLSRSIDYSQLSAPEVTVRVIPASSNFGFPPDTFEIVSSVYLTTAATGGAGAGC